MGVCSKAVSRDVYVWLDIGKLINYIERQIGNQDVMNDEPWKCSE